jgi:hypothetical protein
MIDLITIPMLVCSVWLLASAFRDWRKGRAMTNEGPRYDHSAKAASDISNVYIHSDDPPAITYGNILYRILQAMNDAERELAELRRIVSRN